MQSHKNQYGIWSSRPTLVVGASWSLPSSRIQTPTSLLFIRMIRTIRLTWNSNQRPLVKIVENTCKRKVVLEGLYLEEPQQNLQENDSERPECPVISCKLQAIFIIFMITIIAAIIINIIINDSGRPRCLSISYKTLTKSPNRPLTSECFSVSCIFCLGCLFDKMA